MMEYTLEEDVPEEFKGGTLRINEDEAKVVVNSGMDNNNGGEDTKKGTWKDTFTHLSETFLPRRNSQSSNGNNILSLQSSGLGEAATNYFTFREGIVDSAAKECCSDLLDEQLDGKFLAAFLLTEINLWDSDKERLIILTEKSVFSIKYDFIALKRLEHRKIYMGNLDSVVIGDMVYPSGSLVPERNVRGIRLMWNRGEPLGFTTKWNPFNNDFPLLTLTSHPLYFHEDCTDQQKKLYDMDELSYKLREALGIFGRENSSACIVQYKNIVLQNYIGISSFIHNRNALGFFKVRGKFSF